MYTPQYSTWFPSEGVEHTSWWFRVIQIIGGKEYECFFDNSIPGNYADYIDQFLPSNQKIVRWKLYPINKHDFERYEFVPGVMTYVRALIRDTLDPIPLDPHEAITVITGIWAEKIAKASQPNIPTLIQQRDELLTSIQQVIDGKIGSILDILGIVGKCCWLGRVERLSEERMWI